MVARVDGADTLVQKTAANTVRLRMEVSDGGLCSFSFATAENFESVPTTFQARKGIWIGGITPLGYDVKDRRLVVNRAEAATVKQIYERYLDSAACVCSSRIWIGAA